MKCCVYCIAAFDSTLTLTAKQKLLGVYIDGNLQNLSHSEIWNQTDNVTISNTTRLVAIYAFTLDPCDGIIASTENDYVLTNESNWKCIADIMDSHWYELGYDDSSWLPARHIGSNGNVINCTDMHRIDSISSNAKWILTNSSEPTPILTVCRALLRKLNYDLVIIIISRVSF